MHLETDPNKVIYTVGGIRSLSTSAVRSRVVSTNPVKAKEVPVSEPFPHQRVAMEKRTMRRTFRSENKVNTPKIDCTDELVSYEQ